MSIPGVLFCHGTTPVRMEIDSPAMLRDAVGSGQLPAAVVVHDTKLEMFRECGGIFEDRKIKDGRKSLSTFLLGRDGQIPFIDAKITYSGRLDSLARLAAGR
jgi:hypothetical protein